MRVQDRHLSAGALQEYWLRESSPAETDAAEDHLMRCETCGEALDELIALGEGVRAAFFAGEVWTVSGSAFIRRVANDGLRVREYRVAPNSSVHCTLAPDDELLVARLAAPLQGVQRLDILSESSLAPGQCERLEDVPFDPEDGEIVWIAKHARLRSLPAQTVVVRLLAVAADTSRELGTYTFLHRPWPGWPAADAGAE